MNAIETLLQDYLDGNETYTNEEAEKELSKVSGELDDLIEAGNATEANAKAGEYELCARSAGFYAGFAYAMGLMNSLPKQKQ